MLNHRISSPCDFGSSIMVAVTAITHAVRAKRLIDVPGSNDRTTVTHIQAPNSMNDGVSNDASPRMLSRIASATISTARPPNAR